MRIAIPHLHRLSLTIGERKPSSIPSKAKPENLPIQEKVKQIFVCSSNEAMIRKKWNDLHLAPAWLDRDYEDVKFLVQTRLVYTILGFQNSTASGLNENEIIERADGKARGLWIKKNGQWVSIASIRKALKWNGKENVLVSKSNPLEKWNYYSNVGLIPYHHSYERSLIGRADYPKRHADMRPVAQLTQKEMHTLLAHAQRFGNRSSSTPISCAMQFITHPTLTYQNPLLQNLNAQLNVHCGIRLIMNDGSVYSFGFGGDYAEHAYKKNWYNCLATINGQPKNLDYLEFQKYEHRLVTTVPLNEERAKAILKQLNLYRRNGVRFNLLKQNCVRFGTHLLSQIGIDVNTRVSLKTTLWRAFPNIEHLPLGRTLGRTKKEFSKIYLKTAAKIPVIIKPALVLLGELMLFVPAKCGDLLINLTLLACGAHLSSMNTTQALEKPTSGEPLDEFDRLYSGLFDKEAGYVYHSSIFIQWQLKQQSTEAYQYAGTPSMNILPPVLSDQKKASSEAKRKLRTVYQHSKEVS